MYSRLCDDVRVEVRLAITDSLMIGSFKDSMSVEDVHTVIFNKLGINIEEKYSYNPIMTVIKEEIFTQFNRKLGQTRKSGKHYRLYRCLKIKETV